MALFIKCFSDFNFDGPLELVHGSLKVGCIFFSGIFLNSLVSQVIFKPEASLLPSSDSSPPSSHQNFMQILPALQSMPIFLGGLSSGCYSILGAWLTNLLTNTETMTSFGFLSRLLPATVFVLLDLPINVFSFLIFGDGVSGQFENGNYDGNQSKVEDLNDQRVSQSEALEIDLKSTRINLKNYTQLALESLFINISHNYLASIYGLTFGCFIGFLFLKSYSEMTFSEKAYFKRMAVVVVVLFLVLMVCQGLPLSRSCYGGYFGLEFRC